RGMGCHASETQVKGERPNKGMKLTKPRQLRSFAAYPQCYADPAAVLTREAMATELDAVQPREADEVRRRLVAAVSPRVIDARRRIALLAGAAALSNEAVQRHEQHRLFSLSSIAWLALEVALLVAFVHVIFRPKSPESISERQVRIALARAQPCRRCKTLALINEIECPRCGALTHRVSPGFLCTSGL